MTRRICLPASMRHNNGLYVLVVLVGVALVFPTLGQGQYRGSLHGTITDPQGAVVSGATATLLNIATNRR